MEGRGGISCLSLGGFSGAPSDIGGSCSCGLYHSKSAFIAIFLKRDICLPSEVEGGCWGRGGWGGRGGLLVICSLGVAGGGGGGD